MAYLFRPGCVVAIYLLAALSSAVKTGEAGAARSIRLGVADTMLKLPRAGTTHRAVSFGATVRLELARGEFESAQIVVAAPDERPLKGVRVSLGPLTKVDAGPPVSWPADSITVWRVGYVEVFNLWSPHNSLGLQPDPLLPLDAPFDIPAGMKQPIWVRFRGPERLPAGLYFGTIAVWAQNAAPAKLPVEVRLWDFTLPREQHFTHSVPIWGGQWDAMYPGSVTPARWRSYLSMLLDYRVSPFPLKPEEMDFCYARGQREFCLMCFPADHVPENAREHVAAAAALFRERPWAHKARAYVLLGDEAPPEWYPHIRQQGDLVKEVAPFIRRQFTLSPENSSQGFGAYLDYMSGHADVVILGAALCYPVHDMTQKARSVGLDVWWYYVASHYYIPEDGLEARAVFWRHWKYRVPGQLHWGMTYWGDVNIAGRDGKKWPQVPWDTKSSRSGDGYLVYPAAGGEGVWPSVRLELIRDGIEDYEYLALLESLTGRLARKAPRHTQIARNRRLLFLDDTLVKSYTEYSKDAEAYREYRRRVAAAVGATARLLRGY